MNRISYLNNNSRGEIATFFALTVALILGISAIASSQMLNKNTQGTKANAQEKVGIACQEEIITFSTGEKSPPSGYSWEADCSDNNAKGFSSSSDGKCDNNSQCKQNTVSGEYVYAGTSNWCYNFSDKGHRCMMLRNKSMFHPGGSGTGNTGGSTGGNSGGGSQNPTSPGNNTPTTAPSSSCKAYYVHQNDDKAQPAMEDFTKNRVTNILLVDTKHVYTIPDSVVACDSSCWCFPFDGGNQNSCVTYNPNLKNCTEETVTSTSGSGTQNDTTQPDSGTPTDVPQRTDNTTTGNQTDDSSSTDKPASTTSAPTPPNNLRKMCSDSKDLIKIEWDAVTGATKYEVYKNDSEIFFSNTPFYEDKDIILNKKYKYKVKAINNNGVSGDFSADLLWQLDATFPALACSSSTINTPTTGVTSGTAGTTVPAPTTPASTPTPTLGPSAQPNTNGCGSDINCKGSIVVNIGVTDIEDFDYFKPEDLLMKVILRQNEHCWGSSWGWCDKTSEVKLTRDLNNTSQGILSFQFSNLERWVDSNGTSQQVTYLMQIYKRDKMQEYNTYSFDNLDNNLISIYAKDSISLKEFERKLKLNFKFSDDSTYKYNQPLKLSVRGFQPKLYFIKNKPIYKAASQCDQLSGECGGIEYVPIEVDANTAILYFIGSQIPTDTTIEVQYKCVEFNNVGQVNQYKNPSVTQAVHLIQDSEITEQNIIISCK